MCIRDSVDRLRDAVPDLALGTDIIVGFPGETEADFAETLEVVEEVSFDSAFTFVYSPRAGTEAADMAEQVPEDVKRDRMERLVDVVQRAASGRNSSRVGRVEEVLVEGPSRTDPAPRGLDPDGGVCRAARPLRLARHVRRDASDAP